MTLTNIILINFKKYQEFKLDFEDGLTGIIGKNGSGKSTIFDAITFALYGDVKGSKENIKNSKADEKDSVSVTLEFEIDSKTYKIQREFRGKAQSAQAKLYHNEDELLSSGAKEVTKMISKITSLNKEAFMHTVFASQKELTALSELKNEDRKKIIRKLLGLEKIDKIEQEIKIKLTDLNRDIKSFSEILLAPSEQKQIENDKKIKIKEAESAAKEALSVSKAFDEKNKIVENLQKELETLQIQKDAFTKLEKEFSLITQNLNNQNSNLTTTAGKLKVLQEKAVQYDKEKFIKKEYLDLENKIKVLQVQKEQMLKKEGLEKEQTAMREQYRQFENEIKELSKKLQIKSTLLSKKQEQSKLFEHSTASLQELEKKEKVLNNEISRYNALSDDTKQKVSNIKSLGRSSDCPTCTRPLLEEYDNVIQALQKTISEINKKDINKKEAALKDLLTYKTKEQTAKTAAQKQLQNIDSELKVLDSHERMLSKKEAEFKSVTKRGLANKNALKELKDMSYDPKEHDKANTTKQSLEHKYKELIGIESLIRQIPLLEKEITDIKTFAAKLKIDLEDKIKTIKTDQYDEKLHKTKAKQYEDMLKVKDEIAYALREKEKRVEIVKGEIKAIQAKLDTNQKQKKQLQSKLDDKNDYEKLKLFMGEFKNKINSKVSPRISQLASEMYSTITKGKYQYIEVNDTFDFFIYDEGVRYPIERFSGGEVDLANLVLRIAISKTLSELSGSGSVGFLAFDEVFGSQDEERRLEIMEAFHMIKEQYRQIFLISHESEIKEMFERVVEL